MSRVVFVVLLLVSTAIAAPDPKQIAKDKVVAAERVYKGTLAGLATGRAVAESAYVWSVRWLDAELANAKPAKQALADHLARMTSLEAELGKAKTEGKVPAVEHDAATFFKLEAELWVARGKR